MSGFSASWLDLREPADRAARDATLVKQLTAHFEARDGVAGLLDIGCGSGYSAAILSRLAGSVVGLESDSALSAIATARLAELGYDNVVIVSGNMQDGYPSKAPYDVILLEGSVDFVPDRLLDQLREGGRLVAVEGHGNAGIARIYVKESGVTSGRGVFNTAVHPLPGFERIPQFEF